MTNKVFYVYVLFRPDGRPCYIGKGKGNRWLCHERYETSNLHLKRIIKNAGGELPKVKLYERLTEQRAFELEVELIKYIGREKDNGPLVNLTDGGDGVSGGENHWNGKTHPETSKAIGRALKGRKFTSEWRKRLSISAKKRVRGSNGHYSKEHAAAISVGVSKFWKRRRKENGGVAPSLRSKAGHKKHSLAMLAKRKSPLNPQLEL